MAAELTGMFTRRLSDVANAVTASSKIFPGGRLPPIRSANIASDKDKYKTTELPSPEKKDKEKILKAPRIVFAGCHIKAVTAMTVLRTNCTRKYAGLDISPIIVSGGEDKRINFWNIETG
jgi:hypothetical protein